MRLMSTDGDEGKRRLPLVQLTGKKKGLVISLRRLSSFIAISRESEKNKKRVGPAVIAGRGKEGARSIPFWRTVVAALRVSVRETRKIERRRGAPHSREERSVGGRRGALISSRRTKTEYKN